MDSPLGRCVIRSSNVHIRPEAVRKTVRGQHTAAPLAPRKTKTFLLWGDLSQKCKEKLRGGQKKKKKEEEAKKKKTPTAAATQGEK